MKKIKPGYDDGMWKGAPGSSFGKAQELRNRETEAEKILWERLRGKKLKDCKFRRQHPISVYIADFYCYQLKLVIEIDGGYHLDKEQIVKDKERTELLQVNGIEVIRFQNEEVIKNTENVIKKIAEKIDDILKETPNSNFPNP